MSEPQVLNNELSLQYLLAYGEFPTALGYELRPFQDNLNTFPSLFANSLLYLFIFFYKIFQLKP